MVVGYAGSHGVSNKLEILLRAAELTRHDEIAYVLIGTGPAKPALETFVRERGLVNVFFLPPVSRAAVGSFLTKIDAAYLGWNRSSLYRFGISPNKLLDYMAAGCPVIHGVEAFNDPVGDAKCGISVPPEDPDAVASAVRRLAAMTADERQVLGSRGATYVREHHDNRKLAADFLDFVCSELRVNG
jgi:glycosyltransferase involved in cell wall biosynthesis